MSTSRSWRVALPFRAAFRIARNGWGIWKKEFALRQSRAISHCLPSGPLKLALRGFVTILGWQQSQQFARNRHKNFVAIIPFQPGDIARRESPRKIFEYFALGKPMVVTSDMQECIALEEVLAAGSATEFSAKIDEALQRRLRRGLREPFAAACETK